MFVFISFQHDHWFRFSLINTLWDGLSYKKSVNPIGVVMVNVLALSGVDRGFEPRSGQTKDWLARNQNNVS
jgi:hypothetical protein